MVNSSTTAENIRYRDSEATNYYTPDLGTIPDHIQF